MGYIYKVTNKINNKIYIGLTSTYYQERWNAHLRRAFNPYVPDYNCIFHKAIRKYGKNAFKWEVIEECPNNLLSERERYWIDYYNSYKTGYNMTRGGDGVLLYSNEEILDKWNEGLCIKEICSTLNLDKGQVSNRLKSMGIPSTDIISRGYEKAVLKHLKPVYQYDLDGNFLAEFSSSTEVEGILNIKNVSECCNNKRKTAGGYQWSYVKYEHMTPITKTQSKGKKKSVGQYDINTNTLI